MSLTIALLGGEGIGPEVVGATARVLERLVPDASFVSPIHGDEAIAKHGDPMPESTKEVCRAANAVLYGATLRSCKPVLWYLRWGLETYANLRPVRSRKGVKARLSSNAPVDIMLVRENLEGEYPTREGELKTLNERWPEFTDVLNASMPKVGLFALRLTTEEGCRRISQAAVRQALTRRARGLPGRVTIVTKQNVYRRTDGMFKDTAEGLLEQAGIEHNHLYVDDACRRLVVEPERFDVILAPNLFGDVMSDLIAELMGGLGMMPSGSVGDRYAYFESVHGSAPDIAGKGIANPIATVLSASMLLEHLGRSEEARRLEQAVDRLLEDGRVRTPDLGGSARTEDVVDELVRLI